jgi:nucleotidyltransferase/DNA polymerase involved in DNA repair
LEVVLRVSSHPAIRSRPTYILPRNPRLAHFLQPLSSYLSLRAARHETRTPHTRHPYTARSNDYATTPFLSLSVSSLFEAPISLPFQTFQPAVDLMDRRASIWHTRTSAFFFS